MQLEYSPTCTFVVACTDSRSLSQIIKDVPYREDDVEADKQVDEVQSIARHLTAPVQFTVWRIYSAGGESYLSPMLNMQLRRHANVNRATFLSPDHHTPRCGDDNGFIPGVPAPLGHFAMPSKV